MDILGTINERLVFDPDDICPGGEDDIAEVIRLSPVSLPDDYLDLLRQVSGGDSCGPEFEVEDEGLSISIWSAGMALEKLEEFDRPANRGFLGKAWLFGDDLGDLVYFYGDGKDGFGLYRSSAGRPGFENAEKIAGTLTAFLVDGTGIDIATSL